MLQISYYFRFCRRGNTARVGPKSLGGSLKPGFCSLPRKESSLGHLLLQEPVAFNEVNYRLFLLLAGQCVLSTGGRSERKWILEDSGSTCFVHICGYVSIAGCAAPTLGL